MWFLARLPAAGLCVEVSLSLHISLSDQCGCISNVCLTAEYNL